MAMQRRLAKTDGLLCGDTNLVVGFLGQLLAARRQGRVA